MRAGNGLSQNAAVVCNGKFVFDFSILVFILQFKLPYFSEKTVQVLHALLLFGFENSQFFYSSCRILKLTERFSVVIKLSVKLRVVVYNVDMLFGIHKYFIVMLSVNVYKSFAQLTHSGYRSCLGVYSCAAAAVCGYLTGYHQLVVLAAYAELRKLSYRSGSKMPKHCAYSRFFAAGTHHIPADPFSENGVYTSDKNGLSRARFSRKDVETFRQRYLSLLYYSKIFNIQFTKHNKRPFMTSG